MFDLTGRVALVTGAASGIGAATARIFAAAGADLALTWYPPDGHDIEPVRRAVQQAGRRVLVAAVDVTKAAEVDAFVAQTARELGGLHIVVANAGIARRVELEDLDDDAWNTARSKLAMVKGLKSSVAIGWSWQNRGAVMTRWHCKSREKFSCIIVKSHHSRIRRWSM